MAMSPAPPASENKISDDEVSNLFTWNAHMKSTVALCACIASMSYMIISVFPYSGFMAMQLIPGLTEETTGSYAGLIASSFMAGRALSSYAWGKWADVYGRKLVLFVSLGLSCGFSLTFGMSQTFTGALLSRFLLGLSNGIMGTAKTAVSELAHGNEKLEKRGMGLVVGTWGWGFLWSPAIGGLLAQPVKQHPNNTFVQSNEGWLGAFPFLLPNLVGILLCVLAIATVEAWVPETLPEEKIRSYKEIPSDIVKWLRSHCGKMFKCCVPATDEERERLVSDVTLPHPLFGYISEDDNGDDDWSTYSPENIAEMRLRRSESGNMLSTQVNSLHPRPSVIHVRSGVAKHLSVVIHEGQPRRRSSIFGPTVSSLWARVDTRVHLLLYWLFSFVLVCGDEGFPLYCISKQGGLGLSASSIGNILSGSGLIFGVCQYFVYAMVVNRFGVYESLIVGSLGLPLLVLIPFASLLNDPPADGNTGDASWGAYVYLCSILAATRIVGSIYFSSIFIALNRTVPASHRATMNGLQTLGGSVSKALGPTFAGILATFCFSSGLWSPDVGGFLMWATVGVLGVLNTLAIVFCLREDPVDTDSMSVETTST